MELNAKQMMAVLRFFGTPYRATYVDDEKDEKKPKEVDICFLTRKLGFSDWILFALLTGNMSPFMFSTFAKHLYKEKEKRCSLLPYKESTI